LSSDLPRKPGEHLYIDQRRAHNEMVAPYVIAAQSWSRAAFIAFGVAAVAVGGLVYDRSRSYTVPYVVEVDRLGTAAPIGRADMAAPADIRVIRASLGDWVVWMRSVLPDDPTETVYIRKAYAHILRTGAAFAHANEFFQANSPFARARDGRVDVEPHSVLQLGPTSFQVEWTETQRDQAGHAVGTSDWVATIQVGIVPPTNEDTEKVNPLGIYIESFDWRRRVASLSGGRIFA
jgi:type IV secretion system protein TrbF